MSIDLTKVGQRERLVQRREPYWQRLRAKAFLGYRPSTKGPGGTWIARAFDEALGRYRLKSLGSYGTLSASERFAAARRDAEVFISKVEAGGISAVDVRTVAEACKEYAKSRPDAEARFKRLIYEDPLGGVRLDKLRKRHIQDWRKRLAESPALVSRSAKKAKRTRPRAASSINRDMAPLRAALSAVIPVGAPRTEAAWQEALKAIPNADRKRTLYLDRNQRSLLVKNAGSEAAPFISALCYLPLRPGAVSALTVADFDSRTCELTIGRDKSGESRRIRLPEAAAKFFMESAKGRLAAEPLFPRANGRAWDKNSWKKAINNAVEKAELPNETVAYSLRHSTITDLVMHGLPLLTIAQISGTSAEMIERHYGHLTSGVATEALAKLSLE